jgi:hypothetical protein
MVPAVAGDAAEASQSGIGSDAAGSTRRNDPSCKVTDLAIVAQPESKQMDGLDAAEELQGLDGREACRVPLSAGPTHIRQEERICGEF